MFFSVKTRHQHKAHCPLESLPSKWKCLKCTASQRNNISIIYGSLDMVRRCYNPIRPTVSQCSLQTHDDVIKWKHFPRYWPFVRGIHRSSVSSPHKGQWRGALMFSVIWAWISGLNNREVGDLRRQRAHYDVIVMIMVIWGAQVLEADVFLCVYRLHGLSEQESIWYVIWKNMNWLLNRALLYIMHLNFKWIKAWFVVTLSKEHVNAAKQADTENSQFLWWHAWHLTPLDWK